MNSTPNPEFVSTFSRDDTRGMAKDRSWTWHGMAYGWHVIMDMQTRRGLLGSSQLQEVWSTV